MQSILEENDLLFGHLVNVLEKRGIISVRRREASGVV